MRSTETPIVVGEIELVEKDECGDYNYYVSAVLLGATLSCYAVLLIFFGYLLWKFMWGSVEYLIAFCTYCCCQCSSTEIDGECHRNCPNHPDRVKSNDIWHTAYPHLQHRNNHHETTEKMRIKANDEIPTSPASALLTDHPHPHNANDSLDEFQSIHIHTNSQVSDNQHRQTIQEKRKVQFSI